MTNIPEFLGLIKVNGFDITTPIETIDDVLNRLHYNEADKQEIVSYLKSQGWFTNSESVEFKSEPVQPTVNTQSIPQSQIPQFNPAPQSVFKPEIVKTQNGSKLWVVIATVVVITLLGAGIAYAYVQKIGPFTMSTYTEENLFSGILAKINQIDEATYAMSGSLDVSSREKDATPFVLKVSNSDELDRKYFYDSEKVANVNSIINALNLYAGYSKYNYGAYSMKKKDYPTNLKTITGTNMTTTYGGKIVIVDPVTKTEYDYKVTENGKNFALTINFETNEAINEIKRYLSNATSTIFSGKKVTFTKDSSSYIYMSSEPPKPFLVEISDSLKNLPADVNVKAEITVSSESKKEGLANWLFNINAEGAFGDLTYKVNVDALKKDSDYYFKINNIPSLFLFGDLGSIKGKWVYISSRVATSTNKDDYSILSSIKETIPETEQKYKENREKSVKFIKRVVAIADEQKIISFRKKPVSEKIDGRQLTRYELSFKKESLVPFYNKLQDEINNNPDFSDYKDIVDQGLVEYLQSDEFKQVFDYFDKNNHLILWVDKDGFPAIIQNSMRIVPQDTATQLKDKQINIILKLVIDNINEPVNIEAPKDSIAIEKLISDYNKNNKVSYSSGEVDSLRANLNIIRAQAELAYDRIGSYGKKVFPLGPCSKEKETLFTELDISKSIEIATKNNMSLATCVSKGTTGDVSSWAVSVPIPEKAGFSWCVDSSGNSKQIIEKLKSGSCE